MPARRPPPAPATGRKPQTGLPPGKDGRKGSVLGLRLSYLVWLLNQGIGELHELTSLEETLSRNPPKNKKALSFLANCLAPNPLTAALRLRPGEDSVLRLNLDALNLREPNERPNFDPNKPAVEVMLEFLGSARDLPPLGIIPAAQSGDVFAGWANLDKVREIADHPAVVGMDVLRSFAPTSVMVDGGDGSPGNGNTPHTIATGKGVRLAVIDLGFDFLHPTFLREADSGEEVRAVWLHDMELPPEPTALPGAIGRRLSRDDLQAALVWYRSPEEHVPGPVAIETHIARLASPPATSPEYAKLLQQHGTAVAGIAAGNGQGPSGGAVSATPGVAPNADLVLIAIGTQDETRFANSTKVIAAFQAAFEDSSVPTVTLMANSDNLGPHDGSLYGERFLDDLLLQPGRAIVLTAGNLNHIANSSADSPAWHALALPGYGNSAQLVLQYDSGAVAPDTAEVWFRPPEGVAASAAISIEVRGASIGPPIDVVESAQPVTILSPAQTPHDGTTVIAQLQWDDEADANCLRLVFRPASGREIARSKWTINVTSETTVHGWLDRNNGVCGRWHGPSALAGADQTTLGSPGCAIRPLTVGSAANDGGAPSGFSGCGPLRSSAVDPAARKPDLAAVGQNVVGPRGVPHDRRMHINPLGPAYVSFEGGTSYAAPQVAGACALLFERLGRSASWADIRQAILQATSRPSGTPAPEIDNWDHACGYGLLNLDALLSPSRPETADLWLPKGEGDTGTEPFVADTFWDSPALILEDVQGRALDPAVVAAGEATPARLRVRAANRGRQSAGSIILTAWWAPLGAAHPLPRAETGGGAWNAEGYRVQGLAGNVQTVEGIAPDDSIDGLFEWTPPRDANGRVIPHLLLATVDSDEDPYDPTDTVCAQNNTALLSVAAMRGGASIDFHILGSEDTDGLMLWCDLPHAGLRVEDIPITALPWRDAAMFRAAGRRSRPLYGSRNAKQDMALLISRQLDNRNAITTMTDLLGAERLSVRDGRVTIESRGRLTLPRLRIAQGTLFTIPVTPLDHTGEVHMMHLSGGRRVGGGTARISA